jgi:hypothetical protein
MKRILTQLIKVTSCVERSNITIGAEDNIYLSSCQMLIQTQIGEVTKLQ